MTDQKKPYQTPTVKVMDDEQVLGVFQVTSAGVGWWTGQGPGGST